MEVNETYNLALQKMYEAMRLELKVSQMQFEIAPKHRDPDIPIKYFNTTGKIHLRDMIDIVHGNCNISLRMIDWFVTNYARFNNVTLTRYRMINIDTEKCDAINSKELNMKCGIEEEFTVVSSFISELKDKSKRYFDTFCRRRYKTDIIEYMYNLDGKTSVLHTTIGQFNFFKWAFDNGIIDYVKENADAIKTDMQNRISARKLETKQLVEI